MSWKTLPGRLLLPCVPTMALLLLAAGAVQAGVPRVVRAYPDNGDQDVPPDLKEIRIEFDQDMLAGSHSMCGAGEKFPEPNGQPRWVNKRTFAFPVKLQPNHDYSLSVNCPAAMNFKSAGGESAETYPISFRTGDTVPRRGGAKKLLLETNRAAVQELQRAIDEDYSYRDLRNVDWDKIFKEHGPKLEGAESPAAFARAAAKLLEPAKDLHVWLQVGKLTIATHRRRVPPNCELSTLARVVPDWKKHNDCVATGRFDGGFGYILISTWAPKGPAELEPAFEALDELREAKGIVVDVRSNAGGDELLARDFAGCFVSKPTLYSRNDSGDRSGGEFLQPLDRVVEPKEGRPAYRGKVAVLIGLHNMSSCESFILMMRESGQARLFGERTYGSSGNPKPVDLGNGVTVFLSSWRDMLPDGTLLEGKGIEPDEAVKAGDKGFQKDDPVLEAALAWLRQ